MASTSTTTTTTSIYLSSPDFPSLPKLKPNLSLALRRVSNYNHHSLSLASSSSIKPTTPFSRRTRATSPATEAPPLEEATKEIVSAAGDDGASTVISVLLFVAFAVLTVLTIGVVYIGVSDFLQKREREKLEKEEEEAAGKKKKKGNKKKKAKARAGPRGFGQKIDDLDQFDD